MEQKMEVYIEITARMEDKVDRQLDMCNKRMAVCGLEFRQRVSSTWFRWVIGFVIGGVIAAVSLSADNRVVIREIKKDLVHHVLVTEPKAGPTAAIPQETEGDQDTYKEGVKTDSYKKLKV